MSARRAIPIDGRQHLTFNTAVGAAILTKDGTITAGCNIEDKARSQTVHAENLAVSKALFDGYRNDDFVAIAIVYQERADEPPYPACALCRQWLWENTNENILIIAVDLDGKILHQDTLKNLYPYPYPAKAGRK